MATVNFAQSARTDLLEVWLFIAEENLNAADRVLETIEQEAGILATQPLMGRARPDLAQDIRTWPTSTSYTLFYVAESDNITVVRVLHHARDVQRVLF